MSRHRYMDHDGDNYPQELHIPRSVYRGSRRGDVPRDWPFMTSFSELSSTQRSRSRMSQNEGSRDPDEITTTRGVCVNFAEMTSMPAVNYIHLSRRLWLKMLWILFLVAGCGAMIFHLYYLCSVFFAWPKQTKLVLGFDSLQLPAVTVCNVNPIRLSALKEAGWQLEQLMQRTNTTNLIRFLNESEAEVSGDTSPSTDQDSPIPTGTTPGVGGTTPVNAGTTPRNGETTQRNTDIGANTGATPKSSTPSQTSPPPRPPSNRRRKRYLDDYSVNITNAYTNFTDSKHVDKWEREAPQTTESQIREEFKDLFSRVPRNLRKQIGHQIDSFLVRSSFGGRTIANNNFNVSTSSTFGNCYTLQYNDFISRQSGPDEGLEMVLFLDNAEYLRGWTNGNGIQVVVHQLNTVPLLSIDGLAVAGGTETFIGIKRINIERLSRPYADCNDGVDYWNNYNVIYTRQVCQDFCLMNLVVQQCGCFDERKEDINMMFKLTENRSPCRNVSEIQCVADMERKYEFGEFESVCTCFNPCSETKFAKSISGRQWPSEEYVMVLVEAMCKRLSPAKCHKLRAYSHFQLMQNFIKLNIYYEDLNYENLTEEADYAGAQFASDVGGTLGLWIGLSAISIFEIGQFIIQLCGAGCGCCRGERDYRKSQSRVRSDDRVPEGHYAEPVSLPRNGYGQEGYMASYRPKYKT